MEHIKRYINRHSDHYVVLKGGAAANLHYINCRLSKIPRVNDLDLDITKVHKKDKEINTDEIKRRWRDILPSNYKIEGKYSIVECNDIYNVSISFDIFVDERFIELQEMEMIDGFYVETIDSLLKTLDTELPGRAEDIKYMRKAIQNNEPIGEVDLDEQINKYERLVKRKELLEKCKRIRKRYS